MGKRKDFFDDLFGITTLGVLLFMSIYFVAARLLHPKLTETMLILENWYVLVGCILVVVFFSYLRHVRKKK